MDKKNPKPVIYGDLGKDIYVTFQKEWISGNVVKRRQRGGEVYAPSEFADEFVIIIRGRNIDDKTLPELVDIFKRIASVNSKLYKQKKRFIF